ncbi:MAG TPA: hypothetical protein VGR47_01500 [Terracidiphilus sp.]|nr:hypothetical protein [Terracidiphilus sp.]
MSRLSGRPNAVASLLTGLIDYAGLYPPASLDMRSAVSNYLRYQQGAHAACLGRFVVSLDRMGELREVAGDALGEMRLSVIVPPKTDWSRFTQMLGDLAGRVALEFKVNQVAEIQRINSQIPAYERYFELPIGVENDEILDAIATCGVRAKLRMGGVVAEAFPSARAVAVMLDALARRRIPFKGTAGLHHPIRSRHRLTYEAGSPEGMMHGFLNLAFAAALLYFGGTAGEALKILEEQDAGAWRVDDDVIACRGFRWTADQLAELRKEFFISFGSCSFEEPIRELEVMGWL